MAVTELELLIVVKSYPNPSQSLGEATCVIGVHRDLGLVRIYPVPFRRMADEKQFSKYEVIRLHVTDPRNDPRPNTFRPQLDTIRVVNPRLPSHDHWRARKDWVFPFLSKSMCEIQRQQKATRLSMGFFKPREVTDLIQQPHDEEWSEAALTRLAHGQQDLFMTSDNKLLEKIPYVWKYVYRCSDPDCNGHTQTIIDWEINAFYLKHVKGKGITDPTEVHEAIRTKFLHELCGPTKDTYFFTGNMRKHPVTFLVLGVFWPTHDPQNSFL